MPRRAPAKKSKNNNSLFDSLRFGESYTSLIFGIVVVIIGTVLLLSIARNRNNANPQTSSAQISRTVTQVTDTENEIVISSETAVSEEKLSESQKNNENNKKIQKEKEVKSPRIQQGSTYTVRAGDDLWSIAESAYESGYNWVDVARANKLSNPNEIKTGQKLSIPKAEQKNASSEPEWSEKDTSSSKGGQETEKITSGTYKVKKGDNLWTISVRAYGDGYKWTNVAKANKLSNPDLILEGTTLNLPRK